MVVHHQVLPSLCPYCTRINDHATPLPTGGIPRPGDVSICIVCAGISVWDNNMQLRRPTAPERAVYDTDPIIRFAVTFILERIVNE